MEAPHNDAFSQWIVKGHNAYTCASLLLIVAGLLIAWGLWG